MKRLTRRQLRKRTEIQEYLLLSVIVIVLTVFICVWLYAITQQPLYI